MGLNFQKFYRLGVLSLLGVMSVFVMPGYAQDPLDEELAVSEDAPVDLVADTLENDEKNQIVTAIGNVEMVQQGRILKADRVSYNLATDTVRAEGNVVLNEPSGETYFADVVELTDEMKDGFATGIRGLLADGARFSASEGQRIGGTRLVMADATYTACEPCKDNPEKPPVWQLAASEVIHDQEEQRIIYRNARLEMLGVPVLYTPYFSHPDGSVDQKSGFLVPSFGFDSELGTNYTQEYYWAIAPDKDATIGAMVATDVNPLLLGEYRQRFEDAEIEVAGGITYSDRLDISAGSTEIKNDEVRGHLKLDGLWDISNKWRAGIDTEWASDDQYMRQYNINSQDILENRIYAERFSGRNYANIEAIAFQDIRTSNRQEDQPGLLPTMEASFIGEPNQTFGGRWHANVSALNLMREGNDQDMGRGSAELGWERRLISDSGLVTKLHNSGRADAYYVSDRDIADLEQARSNSSTALRGFVQGHIESSYPLVSRYENVQAIIEPVAALTVGSNVDVDDDIPNEDSEDTVIDSMNVFEPNRFTGLDRIEDRTRATYGLRAALEGDNGYRGEVFFGQSYRFDSDDNPFTAGSGLDEKDSDYVGQVTAQLGPYLDGNYRFQLDNTDFSSQRHEADMLTRLGGLTLGGRYFYGVGLEGTEVEETREQLTGYSSYELNDAWRIFGSARYDFGVQEGLRTASYGVHYTGQCYSVSTTAQRTLTTDSSGDSGTEIFLRIGLKTLGEFATSGLSVDGSEE